MGLWSSTHKKGRGKIFAVHYSLLRLLGGISCNLPQNLLLS